MSFSYFYGNLVNFTEEKFLHQIMQLINPVYHWKKRTQRDNVYWRKIITKVTCTPSLRSETLVTGSKCIRNYFFYFYYHLLLCSSKDLIFCLTFLIFLQSFWWTVQTFSAQNYLNFPMNLLKIKVSIEHQKYFVAHRNMPKIFHDPGKNFPASSPTYSMYSPLEFRFESMKLIVNESYLVTKFMHFNILTLYVISVWSDFTIWIFLIGFWSYILEICWWCCCRIKC